MRVQFAQVAPSKVLNPNPVNKKPRTVIRPETGRDCQFLLRRLLAFIYYFDVSFQRDHHGHDDVLDNGAEEAQT